MLSLPRYGRRSFLVLLGGLNIGKSWNLKFTFHGKVIAVAKLKVRAVKLGIRIGEAEVNILHAGGIELLE